jgi:hypothetical protein
MSRCLIAYTGAGASGKQTHRAQACFNHTEDYGNVYYIFIKFFYFFYFCFNYSKNKIKIKNIYLFLKFYSLMKSQRVFAVGIHGMLKDSNYYH